MMPVYWLLAKRLTEDSEAGERSSDFVDLRSKLKLLDAEKAELAKLLESEPLDRRAVFSRIDCMIRIMAGWITQTGR